MIYLIFKSFAQIEKLFRRIGSLRPVVLNDLKMLKVVLVNIMLTQDELVAGLKDLTAQIQKIGTETSATLAKVQELEAIIANEGSVSPAVEAALAALKAQAQVTDDLIPDAPAPTEPPPTTNVGEATEPTTP